jgi:hypothetical protein
MQSYKVVYLTTHPKGIIKEVYALGTSKNNALNKIKDHHDFERVLSIGEGEDVLLPLKDINLDEWFKF